MRLLSILVVLFQMGVCQAESFYLNGVKVDSTGLRGRTFQNCEVRIDQQGNIYITAPGYTVVDPSKRPQPTTPRPAGRLSKRYFIVTQANNPGLVQYDVEVHVNSLLVQTIRSYQTQITQEITKHVRPGPNKITLRAFKNLEGGRKSYSPSHYFRVIIGAGSGGGATVFVDKTFITFTRIASEDQPFFKTYTIIGE